MERKKKLLSIVEYPVWGFAANLITVIEGVRHAVNANFLEWLKGGWREIVWTFVVSFLLYYSLKMLKETKQEMTDTISEMKRSLDRSLCLSFSIYKKSCEPTGTFVGPNNWMVNIYAHFEKDEIIRLKKLGQFRDEEVGDLIKARILNQYD